MDTHDPDVYLHFAPCNNEVSRHDGGGNAGAAFWYGPWHGEMNREHTLKPTPTPTRSILVIFFCA